MSDIPPCVHVLAAILNGIDYAKVESVLSMVGTSTISRHHFDRAFPHVELALEIHAKISMNIHLLEEGEDLEVLSDCGWNNGETAQTSNLDVASGGKRIKFIVNYYVIKLPLNPQKPVAKMMRGSYFDAYPKQGTLTKFRSYVFAVCQRLAR